MGTILDTVRETVRDHRLFEDTNLVIAAVSGGSDSVFMLRALNELKHEFRIELKAAHLDHMIRGEEARAEAEWVKRLCDELSTDLVLGRRDVKAYAKDHRLSLEDAARTLRYDFFEDTRARMGGGRIALGHTMDDQAETLLLRLCRGSGMTGLASMLPLRGDFARPLLRLRRDEIRRYLGEMGFSYIDDPSNSDTRFRRNFVRHEVIPLLESRVNPAIVEVLARTAFLLAEEDAFLDRTAARDLKKVTAGPEMGIDIRALLSLEPARRRRVLRAAVRDVKGDLNGIEALHIQSLVELVEYCSPGSRVSLPSLEAYRDYDRLIIQRAAAAAPAEYEMALKVPGVTEIAPANLSLFSSIGFPGELKHDLSGKNRACFDLDRLSLPIFVRNRRPGDRFVPYNALDSKKLKDIFIDDKISRRLRDTIPIVADRRGILWVPGGRRSNRAAVTQETERVLCIEARKSSH